ncbi:MAG: replicative DNA helicase [Isosphaeraceae bacterium]|jgi:replicative DNA helicase|nr:MAG: replicative DNA helicase [Isosphaeraceae bacterium]
MANGSADSTRRPSALAEERLPPQNLDAERGVLAGLILDNATQHEVMPILRAEDFYRDSHQIIFRAIRDLYELRRPVDAIILTDELHRRQEYERVGGDEAIDAILASVPHAANTREYAAIVLEKSITRQLIEGANQILRDSYSNTRSAEELLETAERLIYRIAEERAVGDTVELREIVHKAMERIAHRSEERHHLSGLPSGLYDLDDITGGFQDSQLIILAARPSMGKTALALNICDHVAVEQGAGVLFVSLEMAQLELAERLLCSRSRIDGDKLRKGKALGTREMAQLSQAYDVLHGAPLFIDDTPARNMLQITANARRLSMRNKIGLIVVDYIQLIEPESHESRESRQEQIAKISRRLKSLARELKVPVLALSQLNRAVENREDRRPRMADLRESGAIEQDADIVLLLHRPEYYDPNDQPGIAELIVAKNRSGRTDSVKLTFLKNYMKFENLATVAEPIDAATF